MAPKLLPGLSKMTKFMKTKRRNRKKGSGSKVNKESPADDVPAVISTTVHVVKKPQAICSSSYTTSCSSSGYFTSSMRSSDPALTTISTSKPDHHVVEMEDVTWYSSDDTGSCCPSSPRMVPPCITRPSTMRQRALSQFSGQQQQQQHKQKEVLRRSAPFAHHSKSLAFRLRKRNRALSDYDFDQLLTMSRGWTFDPALSEQKKKNEDALQDESQSSTTHTHHRRRALGSTDFDRYIFAPTTATRSQSTSALMAPSLPSSPCRPSMHARGKSEAQLNRDEAVHPFFRPEESSDDASMIDV